MKPVPAPPVKAPPALGSSSASAAPKPSAPVEVIEVPEGGRNSSPLPVRRATRAVETPVVASSVVVDPEEERPLIGLDYHNTIEFEHRVHPSIVEDLKTLQCQGFDLAIVSFASNIETQERVVNTCRELNTQLLRPFTTIAVTRNQVAQGRGKRQVHYRTLWRKSEGDSILGGRCFCGRTRRPFSAIFKVCKFSARGQIKSRPTKRCSTKSAPSKSWSTTSRIRTQPSGGSLPSFDIFEVGGASDCKEIPV